MATASDLEAKGLVLDDKDRNTLRLKDENYAAHTWDNLKHTIATNNLGILDRFPSDLIRYKLWTEQIKAEYGSIIDFVCRERLHWEPLPLSSTTTGPIFACRSCIPFANAEDYRILKNDWPYGVTSNITHLVVWLKTRIPTQESDGDLTPESRRILQDFVRRTFEERLAKDGDSEDRVLWFKNWSKLQSVRGLEHIHVLVRDVPQSILNEWTEVKNGID